MSSSYDILGIPHTAKKEDIKKAYKKLALIHHPDVPGGNAQRFMQIKSAYEQLMVPKTGHVHQQYQYRVQPYVTIHSSLLYTGGIYRVMVDITFRNIVHAETVSTGKIKSSWQLYGMNSGTLMLEKKFLVSCGHKFRLVFTTVNGGTFAKDFQYNDLRPWYEKWWYNFKLFFSWGI